MVVEFHKFSYICQISVFLQAATGTLNMVLLGRVKRISTRKPLIDYKTKLI